MKRYLNILVACFALLGLMACKSPEALLDTMMPEEGPQPTVTELAAEADATVVPVTQLPGQTQAVLGALLSAIRGEKTMARNVSFDPKGEHDIGDPTVEWKQYGVAATEIDMDIVVPVNKRVSEGVLRGVFNFVSDIGQRRSEFFYANYTITDKKKLVITESATGPVYPEFPGTVCFFVDHEGLMNAAPKLTSFRALFLWALANGYDAFATPEEAANKAQFDQLSFFQKMKSNGLLHEPVEGKFAILVFMMDRISPLARFELKMNSSPTGVGPCANDALYLLFDDGYAMGMFQGDGRLFDRNDTFYVHAYYMKEDLEGAELKRIARFSSEKVFPPFDTLSAPPGSDWVTDKLKENKKSPARLLNPRNRDDARAIQQALKEKGYYTSKVDGLFGKGSQGALREFKKGVMGQDNSQWDMSTQQKLFQ